MNHQYFFYFSKKFKQNQNKTAKPCSRLSSARG